ncbi:glycoprotein precursor [Pueraria lobata-associated emaravirus]|uniref:Glycoprotein n=1 Tax=Pueraria lobata-associated emaravirus TaxID=2944626 RepID=A0AAE9KYD0_9VIRU|nr:glycoprotein precursor [Pueraria lobata-associated emaravirus]
MKLISVFNCVIALVIILMSSKAVYNSVSDTTVTCVCKPDIKKMGKEYLVCFEGCPITPVNAKLYNVTCSYMEDITIIVCKNERYIATRPSIVIQGDYIWSTIVNRAWKLIAAIIVWLVMILMKLPSLCFFSLFNNILNRAVAKNLRTCSTCRTRYLFSHIDCPTPGFRHRTDYNLFFYILLVIIVSTTLVKADDNLYNYYKHGNSTEIQVVDKEHYEQDFDVGGYLYTITITNSHLEVDVVNVSEILMPVTHRLTHEHFSCDGEEGCKKECYARTGRNPMYTIRKAHDGFSCVMTNAVLCGLCESEMRSIGYKVTTTNIRPYIDITVKHGNKTEEIKIREFSHYIHEPYYVKPIEPFILESIDYFINGPNVYRGQICNMPSYGCFGPNYKKDGKSYALMVPKVLDPMTFDREIVLVHCIDPGNSDINSLEKTEFVYQNGVMIRPYEFGLISIGIPLVGKLIGDFCERPVIITDIAIQGCYDCQSGIEVKIYYTNPERCGQVKCKIGRVAYEYFVDVDSDHMTIHSFYDKEDVKITCNDYSKEAKLSHSKDTDYYKTNNEVHGSAPYEFNLLKHFPNIFMNFRTMSTTVILLLCTLYMVYNIFKHVHKHYSIIKYDRVLRMYKKKDTYDDLNDPIDEYTTSFTVETGEAQ